jgi:hypothetical protein
MEAARAAWAGSPLKLERWPGNLAYITSSYDHNGLAYAIGAGLFVYRQYFRLSVVLRRIKGDVSTQLFYPAPVCCLAADWLSISLSTLSMY